MLNWDGSATAYGIPQPVDAMKAYLALNRVYNFQHQPFTPATLKKAGFAQTLIDLYTVTSWSAKVSMARHEAHTMKSAA